MSYNLLLIIFFILSFIELTLPNKQKYFKLFLLGIAMFFYWIFFGFRGLVGWDWYNYQNAFNEDIFNFEIGYNFFMNFGKVLFKNYFDFVAFSTFIDIVMLGAFFYFYSPYPIFSLLLFMGFNGIVIQIDLLRHMKVLILFLLSLYYIEKRKKIKYFSINILEILFHRVGLFFLPLFYILNKNLLKYKKVILFLVICGMGAAAFKISIIRTMLLFFQEISFYKIGDKVKAYLSSPFGGTQLTGIGNIERVATFIVFWYYKERIYYKEKHGKIIFNLYILYILSFLLLLEFKILSDRISNYTFMVSYWIIYPIILKINKKYFRFVLYFSLIIYVVLRVNLQYVYNSLKVHEYKNVLITEEDYLERVKIREKEYVEDKEKMKRNRIMKD